MRRALLLMLLTALAVFAADVTGTWKGSTAASANQMDLVLTAKAEGTALTGTMHLYGYDEQIQNGKIDGGNISFRTRTQYGTAVYEGTVNGDEMQLTISIGPGQDITAVLKRAK
jgi:hypothetical protein